MCVLFKSQDWKGEVVIKISFHSEGQCHISLYYYCTIWNVGQVFLQLRFIELCFCPLFCAWLEKLCRVEILWVISNNPVFHNISCTLLWVHLKHLINKKTQGTDTIRVVLLKVRHFYQPIMTKIVSLTGQHSARSSGYTHIWKVVACVLWPGY